MMGLLWLIRKDLALFFADRQGALMTVVVPVVLASLLGMLFAPRSASSVLQLLVVSEDSAPAVVDFVQAIAASASFEVEQTDQAAARERVSRGKASLALILPAGTGEKLRPAAIFLGDPGSAELLYDPSDEIEATMAAGLLTQLLMAQTMGALSEATTMGSMFDELEQSLTPDSDPALRDFIGSGKALGAPAGDAAGDAAGVAAGQGMQPPISFDLTPAVVSGGVSSYNSYAHNFAGMLLMFLLFTAQSRAKHLVSEREGGTLLRLRLTPVGQHAILLGSGLATTVIALLASLVVYAVGILVFGIEILGSVPGFGAVILAQALFVGGFGLLLAGLGRTEAQISSIGTFTVLVMSFAGGAMFPSFLMPVWLRSASLALPTYWATDGLAAMTWRGLPLSAALPSIAVLLGAAVLCSWIGIRRFDFRC